MLTIGTSVLRGVHRGYPAAENARTCIGDGERDQCVLAVG